MNGFDIGYQGNKQVKKLALNLKLDVGNGTILWNKVMKEVEAGRFAGPFEDVPFEFYIQSPIGLVPKDGGDGTRLIFHLSYPRGSGESVNANTPKEMCSVKYPDFDKAIRLCLAELEDSPVENSSLFIGKSDTRWAFRNLGLSPNCFMGLLMKARSPRDNKWYFFVDKCLPFGSSISCALFQEFSNAVAHIIRAKTGKDLVNYLDDYLFAALTKLLCNGQIKTFLSVCKMINFPMSMEKTYWAANKLTFLGLLINAINKLICIPLDKLQKAKTAISKIIQAKKVTVHDVQKLCGLLNFLCRTIVPGRTFTRCIYFLTAGNYKKLRKYHHIRVTSEVKHDLRIWEKFLDHPMVACRPFADFAFDLEIEQLSFYTDASKNARLGFGGWYESEWFAQKWDESFICSEDPSIAYLELYALTCSFLLWANQFRNRRILVNCDNQGVVQIVNNTTLGCKNCMVLIRLIVMESMVQNVRLYVKYVSSAMNEIADALSRQQWARFHNMTKDRNMDEKPREIHKDIWPIQKI